PAPSACPDASVERPMSDELPSLESLVPPTFDEITVVLLTRHPDPPDLSEETLDRLQVEHFLFLRDRMAEGVLIANGPLRDQTDQRYRGIAIYALPMDEAFAVANTDVFARAGWFQIHGGRWLLGVGNV